MGRARITARYAAAITIALAVVLSMLPASPAFAEDYEVQPGDTFSGIAVRLGISPSVLELLNPDISPDLLFVGQQLRFPDNVILPDDDPTPTTAIAAAARVVHRISPGDTLSGIAELYGTQVDQLLALNPELDRDVLFWGFEIVVRNAGIAVNSPSETIANSETGMGGGGGASPSEDLGVGPYIVQAGDTLSGIASVVGVPLGVLRGLNPVLQGDTLHTGSVIFIPFRSVGGDAPSTGAERGIRHQVQPGDSASGIAETYGFTLEELQAANPNADLAMIYVGQEIVIPVADADIPALDAIDGPAGERTVYTVRPGDTATGIAAVHGISYADLRQLNPGSELALVYIGQTLIVPKVDLPPPAAGSVPAGPAPHNTHSVIPGDTLSAVADTQGVELAELRRLNPQLSTDLLTVGQILRIPGTAPVPIVSRTIVLDVGGTLELVAAKVGVLPHTLQANNGMLDNGWIVAGTALRVPDREGIVVTVQPGDTLIGIARFLGSSVDAVLADTRNGVLDPNGLIIGQELIVPVHVPSFIWPAPGQITDGFGLCRNADCTIRHNGLDISQHKTAGGPILAIADGVVSFTGGSACCGKGYYVEIEHGNGWLSVYGHLNALPPVFEGQQITQGTVIGYSGNTGYSTGTHLHLELHHNGWRLDPLNYLP